MKKQEPWTVGVTRIILLMGFLIGMGYCLYLFSANTLTPRESTLLGVMLTICSTAVSWMITHIYSAIQITQAVEEVQERSQANLRTYALKASEKVNNLSNELNRLSLYLEQELGYEGHENPQEALQAREERIESAIHIIRTLKSVNDTSLSDWEGVIGEELDQQREERREKEQELIDIISRVEEVVEGQRQDIIGSQASAETLRTEVHDLKKDLRTALFELGGTRLPTKTLQQNRKTKVELPCPICASLISYSQRPKENSVKSIPCKNCGKKLVSRFSTDKGYTLEVRALRKEEIICPTCKEEQTVLLDVIPGAGVSVECNSCQAQLRVTRTASSIAVRNKIQPASQSSEDPLPEELILQVRDKMPEQPWEDGIHKKVAEELGVNARVVNRAITELIKRGIFNPQIDGIVYERKALGATQNAAAEFNINK